jgi:hypothetical protein
MRVPEGWTVASDIVVRHDPTGATFSTYRYESIAAVTIQAENRARAGKDDHPRIEDLRPVALDILRGLARRRFGSE